MEIFLEIKLMIKVLVDGLKEIVEAVLSLLA